MPAVAASLIRLRGVQSNHADRPLQWAYLVRVRRLAHIGGDAIPVMQTGILVPCGFYVNRISVRWLF